MFCILYVFGGLENGGVGRNFKHYDTSMFNTFTNIILILG